eukprot:490072-Pyramimonas_sp.AAC.1
MRVGGHQSSARSDSLAPHRASSEHLAQFSEGEHVVGIAEFLEESLVKIKSSQSVCVIAICRSGRLRFVAVSY